MKKNNIKYFLLAICCSFFLVISCDKNYYEEGGVHSPEYNGTILQFLKSRPELFSELIKVVELSGYNTLLDDPNKEITFFAPSDVSIQKSMLRLNRELFLRGKDTVKNLNQVSPEIWKKFVSRYIYEGKSMLKDFPHLDTNDILAAPGQSYISYNGEILNIGVFKNDVVTKNSSGEQQIAKYVGYRQLIIGYSNPVATSDIQPTNGVVHVLNFTKHSFGFRTFEFVDEAINRGILY